MANSKFRSNRKVSGKKYVNLRKQRASEMAGLPALTSIGKDRLKVKRTLGGNAKKALLSATTINVTIKNKTLNLKIDGVENNPANINFTRRNLITKGAIVKTEKGNVRVTSRPGQSGALFGVLN